MAFLITTPQIGFRAITDTSTTLFSPLGTIVTAVDPVYGTGEFIYLAGVASTAVGSAVTYDLKAGTTTLATTGTRGPIAVAMSANVAGQYGWYQISGEAVVLAATATAGLKPYVNAAAGSLISTVVATNGVDNATFESATGTPSAGYAVVTLTRSAANGNG